MFNANSGLLQNRTEKQKMVLKTTVTWLFHDICYLVIGSFYLKIALFQQTVVRVYHILKYVHSTVLPAFFSITETSSDQSGT